MRTNAVSLGLIYGSIIGGGAVLTSAFHTTNSLGTLPKKMGFQHRDRTSTIPCRTKESTPRTTPSLLKATPQLNGDETSSLLFWITAFSSSHIGMSAIRQTLIDFLGGFLANDVLGIVGTKKLKLPDVWPGDSLGTNELFPDVETTGRQLYRIFYTMVSFVTLGNAFAVYLALCGEANNAALGYLGYFEESIASSSTIGEFSILVSFLVATFSGAFSLASLVNASPLGLMPSFQRQNNAGSSDSSSTTLAASDTVLGITRDDSLKFIPTGLTRITRHPLILPVVPWGMATSILAGGRDFDFILFGGLSLYAIAGCYCQDLRVLRNEGSVGTTFFVSNNDTDDETTTTTTAAITDTATSTRINNTALKSFYERTSFVPFQALWDGRQSWELLFQEFPILPFLMALPTAYAIETVFLRFLGVDYGFL